MAVETRKKTSAKTLQTAREASFFAKKMYRNALDAQKEGRPTAWSMVTLWQEAAILKSMGLEVIYPENYGALCASVQKAEPYLTRSLKEGYPSNLCGYARNALGYSSFMHENNMQIPPDAPAGGMARPTVLVSSGVLCDARYKWFQAQGRYLSTPVFTLELPHTGIYEFDLPGNKEQNIRMIHHSLKEFVAFLERLLQRKMDWDRLEALVAQTFETLRLAHEVDRMRQAVPSPMVAQDFWAIMVAHYYLSHDPEAFELYKRVHAEVKQRVENGIGAIPNEKYRMLFAELPPWHSLGFFDTLAERFGIALVMESWSYHAPSPIDPEEIEGTADPLERIARLTYHKMTEYMGSALRYDAGPSFFMGAYPQWAEDYRADGLFAHALLSCHPATYTLRHIGNVLAEKLKVPSIVIDGDIVDLRVFNEEDALARVEAFVEVMDHHRDLRKRDGLSW